MENLERIVVCLQAALTRLCKLMSPAMLTRQIIKKDASFDHFTPMGLIMRLV